jgi:hypothetical protein
VIGHAAQSVERQVRMAEASPSAAGVGLGAWYGNGDWAALSWSARRQAAARALTELDEAARRLAAAREALATEIQIQTDRHLAEDQTRCSAQWGVCPTHGNTLSSSGGRTWCRQAGCGRTWPGSRVARHCDEPAEVVVADQAGDTMQLCAGHWTDARLRMVGARLVRVLPAAQGGA